MISKEERIAVVRASLLLFRLARDCAGGDLDRAHVILAARIGVLEGRPLTVTSIAQTTGIPRSTVMRKLEEAGATWQHVNGHRVPIVPPLGPDRAVRQALRIYRAALRELTAAACFLFPLCAL
jgi:hypothetical protein